MSEPRSWLDALGMWSRSPKGEPPLPDRIGEALLNAGADRIDRTTIALALAAGVCTPGGDRGRRTRVDATTVAVAAGVDRASVVARLSATGALVGRGLVSVADGAVVATDVLIHHALGLDVPAAALAAVATIAGPPLADDAQLPVPDGLTRWLSDAGSATVAHLVGAEEDRLVDFAVLAAHSFGLDALIVGPHAGDPRALRAVAADCLLRPAMAVVVAPPPGAPWLPHVLDWVDLVCVVDTQPARALTSAAAGRRPQWEIAVPAASPAERTAVLTAALARWRLPALVPDEAATFVRRHRLGPVATDRVVGTVSARRRGSEDPERATVASELAVVAAELLGQRLHDLATTVTDARRWDALALPADTVEQLAELCSRVDLREIVLDEWGFATMSAQARGVTALFAGPSGTGKTLAASVVANELGLALHRVDLARVVSKYIGETERNLDAVFAAAEASGAILLFDEADALFGKRSEVQDAHDRYANLEVAYLLQRMETYDGLAILSTNLLHHLDESFTRRLTFVVAFPFPDATQRRRIWQLVWPPGAPVADDLDLDLLATAHRLSGGHIRNVALAAAHLAAERGGPIGREHVDRALQRELGKIGHPPTRTVAA